MSSAATRQSTPCFAISMSSCSAIQQLQTCLSPIRNLISDMWQFLIVDRHDCREATTCHGRHHLRYVVVLFCKHAGQLCLPYMCRACSGRANLLVLYVVMALQLQHQRLCLPAYILPISCQRAAFNSTTVRCACEDLHPKQCQLCMW